MESLVVLFSITQNLYEMIKEFKGKQKNSELDLLEMT